MKASWVHRIAFIALIIAVAFANAHENRFAEESTRISDDILIVEDGATGDRVSAESWKALMERLRMASELGIEVDDRNLFVELASRSLEDIFLSPKVLLGEQEGLRGLYATEDIEEGEILARVPKRYFLSSVASEGRMKRLLKVIKEQVFDAQDTQGGKWINVDFHPWEIQVLSTLATVGIAEEGDTPEKVAEAEKEYQESDEEIIALAAKHAKEGMAFHYFDGLSDEEVAAKWFFLGVPPFREYASGRGPLLEMPSIPELSETEKKAMQWAFPEVDIESYTNVDKRVFEYFSEYLYGKCFSVPGEGEQEGEEEICIRQLSFKFFQYMCAIASRYCFSISSLAAGQIGYVSLINHGYHETMHWESTPSEFILQANRGLPKGEEILISYGGLSMRSSVFNYGFYDTAMETETSMVIPFAHALDFGPREDSLCSESVLAGLSVLPSAKVAHFPYEVQLAAEWHAFDKVEACGRISERARHALKLPKEAITLHPFQRRMVQCSELRAELRLYEPGFLEVDSWKLLRLLHAEAPQFRHLDVSQFVNKEMECKSINTALLILESELAIGNPLSPYADGDSLVDAIAAMQETIVQMEALLASGEGEVPSTSDIGRSHGVVNAVRVVNAEKKLLRNTIAALLTYEEGLGCKVD